MRIVTAATLFTAALFLIWASGQGAPPVDESATPAAGGVAPAPSTDDDDKERAIVSGKVVSLAEAFKKRGIKSYSEEVKGQVVLLSNENEIIPIVPDWRGRAFYQDERLRDRPVDLLVIRRAGVPWVQVLSIYTFDEQGARNMTDYWCDVCSIPMYEIKECECCQGPIRLRFRPQELPRDLNDVAPPGKEKSEKTLRNP